MMSLAALSDTQKRFGIIVEAHGPGRVKPLDFQMIQGGFLDVDKEVEPFSAIAMRVKLTVRRSLELSGKVAYQDPSML